MISLSGVRAGPAFAGMALNPLRGSTSSSTLDFVSRILELKHSILQGRRPEYQNAIPRLLEGQSSDLSVAQAGGAPSDAPQPSPGLVAVPDKSATSVKLHTFTNAELRMKRQELEHAIKADVHRRVGASRVLDAQDGPNCIDVSHVLAAAFAFEKPLQSHVSISADLSRSRGSSADVNSYYSSQAPSVLSHLAQEKIAEDGLTSAIAAQANANASLRVNSVAQRGDAIQQATEQDSTRTNFLLPDAPMLDRNLRDAATQPDHAVIQPDGIDVIDLEMDEDQYSPPPVGNSPQIPPGISLRRESQSYSPPPLPGSAFNTQNGQALPLQSNGMTSLTDPAGYSSAADNRPSDSEQNRLMRLHLNHGARHGSGRQQRNNQSSQKKNKKPSKVHKNPDNTVRQRAAQGSRKRKRDDEDLNSDRRRSSRLANRQQAQADPAIKEESLSPQLPVIQPGNEGGLRQRVEVRPDGTVRLVQLPPEAEVRDEAGSGNDQGHHRNASRGDQSQPAPAPNDGAVERFHASRLRPTGNNGPQYLQQDRLNRGTVQTNRSYPVAAPDISYPPPRARIVSDPQWAEPYGQAVRFPHDSQSYYQIPPRYGGVDSQSVARREPYFQAPEYDSTEPPKKQKVIFFENGEEWVAERVSVPSQTHRRSETIRPEMVYYEPPQQYYQDRLYQPVTYRPVPQVHQPSFHPYHGPPVFERDEETVRYTMPALAPRRVTAPSGEGLPGPSTYFGGRPPYEMAPPVAYEQYMPPQEHFYSRSAIRELVPPQQHQQQQPQQQRAYTIDPRASEYHRS